MIANEINSGRALAARYEAGGIFFARLLPVIRHLISIPAGIVRMNFTIFSRNDVRRLGALVLGSGWFGTTAIASPRCCANPEGMADLALTVQGDRSRGRRFLRLCTFEPAADEAALRRIKPSRLDRKAETEIRSPSSFAGPYLTFALCGAGAATFCV